MIKPLRVFSTLFILLSSLAVAPAFAQQAQSLPTDVQARAVDILSEGTRMSATVYTPASAAASAKLPTILMAHGWGGVAAQLRRDAIAFAQAGLVDPVDMLADWENAMHWLHGEAQVDTDRIGVWGSSQSGDYVVEMAIRDARIKAVHSQVGSLSGRSIGHTPQAFVEATQRTQGEISYPQAGATVVGNLRGAPIANRFANYAPVDNVNKAGNIPLQFVIAENEELFDNREHSMLAHERYQGPKNLVVIPGIAHYGIYREAWQQANQLAIDWFNQHLN